MTSSQQVHFLDLIRNKRWVDASARTNSEKGREQLRRKGEYGALPLHEACDRGAPLELVAAMLEGYEEAVTVADDDGELPLHCTCCPVGGADISPGVVRLLLEAYPDGIKATTDDGNLPLHLAAINNAPSEVLTMLVNAHPEGASTRSNDGELPLHCLAEQDIDVKENADKIDVLLRPLLNNEEARHCRHPLCKTPLHIGAKFDLLELHVCLQIPRCPAEVIVTVAQRHPEQLREWDEDGSLPLHIAAGNPNLNGALDGQDDLVVKLVRLYPDAAAALDGDGRSPLNLAIESGKRWKEGVEAIADAAKGVRTIRDVGTNLFPFMLAASCANPCTTTVYELLRCCPDMCKKP